MNLLNPLLIGVIIFDVVIMYFLYIITAELGIGRKKVERGKEEVKRKKNT